MEEVRVVKVVVNRMPENCVYVCPLMDDSGEDGESCCLLRRSVCAHHSTIHPDCPLTTA